MTTLLKLINLPSANKYLPIPMEIGEIVKLVDDNQSSPDKFQRQFVKIYRFKYKQTVTFHKTYFTKVNSTHRSQNK